jgi:Tfp pilus assembly major pilin PilA
MNFLVSLLAAIVVPVIQKYLDELGVMLRLQAIEKNQAEIKSAFDNYSKAVTDEERKSSLRELSNKLNGL